MSKSGRVGFRCLATGLLCSTARQKLAKHKRPSKLIRATKSFGGNKKIAILKLPLGCSGIDLGYDKVL